MAFFMRKEIIAALKEHASPIRAKHHARFFKIGPGEYGEGDIFLGIKVPDVRKVAKIYKSVNFNVISELLESEYHECRLLALIILVNDYLKTKLTEERIQLGRFYLDNLRGVNNWDLVDISAPKILYEYSLENPEMFDALLSDDDLWKNRIAIMATWPYIRLNEFTLTLNISERLLSHPHDLIHKAVGWMLRELGKKDKFLLLQFLEAHYKNIPRTALRYAIEKIPGAQRKEILRGNFNF